MTRTGLAAVFAALALAPRSGHAEPAAPTAVPVAAPARAWAALAKKDAARAGKSPRHGAPPAPGTVNSVTIELVATLNKVVMPVPLSAIHHGVVGPETRPQALTRLASVWSAGMNPSEMRLCWR